MDIKKVIEELHAELARIDEAIETLERLQDGRPRRGRPPGWLTLEGGPSAAAPRKSPTKKPARKAVHF